MSMQKEQRLFQDSHTTFDSREMSRPTVDVMTGLVVADAREYFAQPYQPTPLDPEYAIAEYIDTAFDLMMERAEQAAEVNGLTEAPLDWIRHEIAYEHGMRCDKNELRMERLRVLLEGYEALSYDMAEVITRARAGQATISEYAALLAAYPELDGLEVMKSTRPLDFEGFSEAHTVTTRDMTADLQENRIAHLWLGRGKNPLEVNNTKHVDTSQSGQCRHVKLFKTIEAQLELEGVPMELVTRRTYIRLPEGCHQVPDEYVKDDGSTVQPIAISKYLRLARPTDYSSLYIVK